VRGDTARLFRDQEAALFEGLAAYAEPDLILAR
jgi:hypothetical protein